MPVYLEVGGREIITIKQACQRTGVSRRTIYSWVERNKVEWLRLAGGPIRIFADTLFVQDSKCNRYTSTTQKGPDADSE